MIVSALFRSAIIGRGSASAQTPFHVCGVVTDYFVSDIPSGGAIQIDGKDYPIASSASYTRTQPLPEVTIGSHLCVDGTTNESGLLLDFTVMPRPSSAPPSPTATALASLPATPAPSSGWPLLAAAAAAVAGGLFTWAMRARR